MPDSTHPSLAPLPPDAVGVELTPLERRALVHLLTYLDMAYDLRVPLTTDMVGPTLAQLARFRTYEPGSWTIRLGHRPERGGRVQ